MKQRQELLDSVYEGYCCNQPQDDLMRRLVIRTFKPFFKQGGNALELGCSNGYMTELLAPNFSSIDVLEAVENFIKDARARNIPNAIFHHTLFESFHTKQKFDVIMASYMLTHIPDDVGLLKHLHNMLKDDGRVFVVTPNSRVLSRQLALHMGYIEDLKLLTDHDRNHAHHHAYDRVSLNRTIKKAGFKIISQGGIMLKPFADFQMDKLIEHGIIGDEQLEGLYSLGFEYPDLCSALFAICEKE